MRCLNARNSGKRSLLITMTLVVLLMLTLAS
jgi:hypothetical protein